MSGGGQPGENIRGILDRAAEVLRHVPGVIRVVLGGSRARGNHAPDADIDIGIYYDAALLNLSGLDTAAKKLDDQHRGGLINPPGMRGRWVNGGAWRLVGGYHLDFILRDMEHRTPAPDASTVSSTARSICPSGSISRRLLRHFKAER